MKTIEVIRVLTIVAFVLKSTVSMAQPEILFIYNNTDSDTVFCLQEATKYKRNRHWC